MADGVPRHLRLEQRPVLIRLAAGAALAVIVGVAVLFAVAQEGGAEEGAALQDLNRWTFSTTRDGAFAPGQEFTAMVAHLRNETDEPLRIESIEPLDAGPASVARVVAIELAPRGRLRRDGGAVVPPGVYQTYPLASRFQGRCVRERLVAAQGFVLPPSRGTDDVALLAVRVEVVGTGRFKLGGERVYYRRQGERYYEDIPFALDIPVTSRPGRPPSPDERRCVGKPATG